MNNILPRRFLQSILCCNNITLPINNTHYITGRQIYNFSNNLSSLMCVENTLSNFTCNINNICSNMFRTFGKR